MEIECTRACRFENQVTGDRFEHMVGYPRRCSRVAKTWNHWMVVGGAVERRGRRRFSCKGVIAVHPVSGASMARLERGSPNNIIRGCAASAINTHESGLIHLRSNILSTSICHPSSSPARCSRYDMSIMMPAMHASIHKCVG